MLAKKYRLQKGKDFELVFKEGKNIDSEFLFLKSRKNNLKISRFGFAVGKKISKKSTARNRIKRRLSETIRMKLGKVKQGFDVVIIAKSGIVNKNYLRIDEVVEKMLRREKLI